MFSSSRLLVHLVRFVFSQVQNWFVTQNQNQNQQWLQSNQQAAPTTAEQPVRDSESESKPAVAEEQPASCSKLVSLQLDVTFWFTIYGEKESTIFDFSE